MNFTTSRVTVLFLFLSGARLLEAKAANLPPPSFRLLFHR